MLEQAPAAIRRLLEGRTYTADHVGRSGAGVLCFDDWVLKIAADDACAAREAAMMRWLHGRLPVPEVLQDQVQNGRRWLLMSRLPGKMACDAGYLSRPQALIPLLAQGLKGLWQVDADECPGRFGLDQRLEWAENRVRAGLVDVHDAEPETFGPGGFSDPAALLRWLKEHRPPLDPVLSHGDFCLPNLFLQNDEVSGYLDLGYCAVADRWQDIALCWRSLRHNADGSYGGVYPQVRPDALFPALGLAPDWGKIRYYLLLDELF